MGAVAYASRAVKMRLVVTRAALAWLLLRVLGSLVVPVGYERLNPAAAARRQASTRTAVPQPAIEARAPLAIEAPRTFVAGEVISEEPASVTINGTRHEVLPRH
jgi:hypothetical protein